MAITKAEPSLKVQVFSKGIPLEEYQDDDEQEISQHTVTKYVEVSSGDYFDIRYSFNPAFRARHDVLVEIKIDGQGGDSQVLFSDVPSTWSSTHTVSGAREAQNGRFTQRKFCFARLDTNDGDIRSFGEELRKKLDDVGTITARYFWVTASETRETTSRAVTQTTLGVIPEKALKGSALSHQASYGTSQVIDSFRTCNVDKVSNEPFATFNFRYRSRSALKSLLIIPRSPSPVPLEERDIDTLTPQESRELLRRLRERDEAARVVKLEGVKRERTRERSGIVNTDDDDDNDDISFVSAKRRRHIVIIDKHGVETIDLT